MFYLSEVSQDNLSKTLKVWTLHQVYLLLVVLEDTRLVVVYHYGTLATRYAYLFVYHHHGGTRINRHHAHAMIARGH